MIIKLSSDLLINGLKTLWILKDKIMWDIYL